MYAIELLRNFMRAFHGLTLLAPMVVALGGAAAGAASAQVPPPPHADWRTVETDHFSVHYTTDVAEWARPVAARLDAVHAAVADLVGFAPAGRVQVVVGDPVQQANGFAWPGPAIVLWPTPPTPRQPIAESREWGEMLSVHEFAHVAHLNRPSRNAWDRFVVRLLPVPLGPIRRRAPRWVVEGYATWVEGRITGSGRPHGVWRAAILRQWALEGRLPAYAALDRSGGFYDGAMAYLAGSAFLEWLVEREGDTSLPALWRRLSARRRRDFRAAFAGVFGDAPSVLYGRWRAEVTGRALDVETMVDDAGRANGTLIQELHGSSGRPAVSADGRHLAMTLNTPGDPSRLVVFQTAPDTTTVAERDVRRRTAELDPEDVPAVQRRPRPKRPLATLYPVGGRAHASPRFLAGGEHVLVVRYEGLGDGRRRTDLFEWHWPSGRMRRVTHGAGIRSADPLPDGKGAVAVRCGEGRCDLVHVDLASGAVRTLLRGSPERSFAGPRAAPDGKSAVVAVHEDGRWQVLVVDLASGSSRALALDDPGSRFEPAFTRDGRAVVVVSDASGIHNLERIDLETGARSVLTRVTGAAIAPEPDDDQGIFYLNLRSHGFDLRRVEAGGDIGQGVAADPRLAPAVRVPLTDGAVVVKRPVGPGRAYGAGPGRYAVLPWTVLAQAGLTVGAAVARTDPVGRLGWVARGAFGSRSAWRGAAVEALWRGSRPAVRAALFYGEERPGEQDRAPSAAGGLDADYLGAVASVEASRDLVSRVYRVAAGVSSGRISGAASGDAGRHLAFGSIEARYAHPGRRWLVDHAIQIHGAAGSTDGEGWRRMTARGLIGVQRGAYGVRATALYGVADGSAPAYERFTIGGPPSPLVPRAVFDQRVPLPAVPVGYAAGRRAVMARAELRVPWPVVPYAVWAAAGSSTSDFRRVVGVEFRARFDGLWIVGLPASEVVGGVGRSLDLPFRDETRGYVSLTYHP